MNSKIKRLTQSKIIRMKIQWGPKDYHYSSTNVDYMIKANREHSYNSWKYAGKKTGMADRVTVRKVLKVLWQACVRDQRDAHRSHSATDWYTAGVRYDVTPLMSDCIFLPLLNVFHKQRFSWTTGENHSDVHGDLLDNLLLFILIGLLCISYISKQGFWKAALE